MQCVTIVSNVTHQEAEDTCHKLNMSLWTGHNKSSKEVKLVLLIPFNPFPEHLSIKFLFQIYQLLGNKLDSGSSAVVWIRTETSDEGERQTITPVSGKWLRYDPA